MSHDYDPNWDYPICDLDAIEDLSDIDKKAISDVIARVIKDLAPALGFVESGGGSVCEVFFTEPMGLSNVSSDTAVAVYCNGTSSRPVVGFDVYAMKEICVEEGLNLVHQFELSLAHELGHAYQDACGLDHEHTDGFNEDAAEEFGRAWADSKRIELWRLNPELPKENDQRNLPRRKALRR